MYSRVQRDITPEETKIFNLDTFLEHLRKLAESTVFRVTQGYLIVSPKGAKKQEDHYDFECVRDFVEQRSKIEGKALPSLPFSFIIPLYRSGCDIHIADSNYDVHVDYGSCLIFRGDVLHSGTSYDAFNLRFFAYLDTLQFPYQYEVFFPTKPEEDLNTLKA